MAEQHTHPMNPSQIVFGRRLHAGETIQVGDVYDSTSGKWEKALCSGSILRKGCATYWVRKETSFRN